MRRLSTGVVLALLPTAGVALAGSAPCDIYPAMSLGPFPTEASTKLFHGSEDAGSASFKVRWSGLACGRETLRVNAEYGDQPGSAVENADYHVPQGQRTPDVCEVGCASGPEASVSFPLLDDVAEEAVVETFTVVLSNPDGGSLDPPTSAPFLLIDDDGVGDRVALDELEYAVSEAHERLVVPVWRAGPAGGTAEVPYTVGSGTASAEADYSLTSPNPLVFGPGDRVELVTLTLANDGRGEPEETVELALGTPVGATVATPSSKVLRILDGAASGAAPQSRIHHPRHGRTYAADDFRLREVHVFTEGPGGAQVAHAHLALRSNLRGGGCEWQTGKGFRPGSCGRPRWVDLKTYEPDFFYVRLGTLPPSTRGSIKSYTVFSRALDAGNLERGFAKGRNQNRFEVRPARGPAGR